MRKYKLWIISFIFIILISSVFYYQKTQKDQFIEYLQNVDQAFANLEPIQKLSLEANQAGMTGDHEHEAKLNGQLIKESATFTAQFEEIPTKNKKIAEIHQHLLNLNNSTHQLLQTRIEILSQIKNQQLAQEDAKEVVNDFWEMQEQNKQLYKELITALEKQSQRYDLELTDYLKNL